MQHAMVEDALRLTFRRRETRITGLPVRVFIGETRGDLVAVMPLERAIGALAQTLAQLQRQAEHLGNRLRGLLRALQVAGINRIEPRALLRFIRDAARKALRLLEPGRRKRNVDVTLNALDAVPVGLAVADEQNLRGHGMKWALFAGYAEPVLSQIRRESRRALWFAPGLDARLRPSPGARM